MESSIADRVRRMRLRAEEARTIGEAMQSPEARRLLLGIADNYDRLADSLDALEKPKSRRENLTG